MCIRDSTWYDVGGSGLSPVTHYGVNIECSLGPRTGCHRDSVDLHADGLSLIAITDHKPICLSVEMQHEIRLPRGNPDPAPLTNSVVHQPLVLTDHLAIGIHDVTGARHLRSALAHKISVGAIPDEADFLAFRLVRDRQPIGARQPPHLWLGQSAQRELDVAEMILRHGIEYITLILALVDGPHQSMRHTSIRIAMDHPRVVALSLIHISEPTRPY